MVRCCRRLWEAGLIAGQDGNVSVRVGRDRLLVTPRGRLKRDLAPADLVEVDLAGRVRAGRRAPSSELGLHLALYAAVPEAGAVVHAHPPTATGFAAAGVPLDGDVLPELAVLVGPVPIAPYATPGSPAVGEGAARLAPGRHALLLANHGAVTWGDTLDRAQLRMESLEHAARILLVARQLGGPVRLAPEALAALVPPTTGRTP